MLERWTTDAVAKTETKAKAELLLAIIREKFSRVPKETEQTILAMTDPVALQSWAVQASMCQSLDEFTEALR